MMNTLKTIGAAAVIAALPVIASATTVAPGSQEFSAFVLTAGGSASFNYDSVGPVRVNVIAVSGTGFNDGADLGFVRFGVNSASNGFTSIIDSSPLVGSTASATGSLASFILNSPFSLEFDASGTSSNTQMTYAFTVSQVPVPAAGLLMLGALASFGAMRRRNKKA